MAAITMNNAVIRNGIQFLESCVVTNGASTADGTGFNNTDIAKYGVAVPPWATKLTLTIFYDSSGGTSPLFDFVLGTPDWGSLTLLAAPTDATDQAATLGNGAWNGITQITGTGPYQIVVEVGPDVTDDDTGSATATCYYGVKCELPPVITYTMTIDSTSNDEDYTIRMAAMWR